MTLQRLALAALVVPEQADWSPQVLGEGSIVDVHPEITAPSPLGLVGEIAVHWLDVAGRTNVGWLAKTTTFSRNGVKARALARESSGDALHAYDLLRSAMGTDRAARARGGVKAPWSVLDWCSRLGSEFTPLYPDVIREFGGAVPRNAEPEALLLRTLRSIFSREVTMTEVKEAATAPTKKAAAKKTAKKGDKQVKRKVVAHADGAPARSMSRTTGNTLLPLFEKCGAKREAISLAKRLANDEDLTKTEFKHLRDLVNEAATTCRENNKNSLASSLSAANKLVRRLARR